MTDDNNAPKLDLDLIQMVQRARMMNDDTAQPSQVSAVYWIEAKAPDPAPTPRAGKWIIPTTVDVVDNLWAQVKAATEAGELGYKAKVSTSPGKEQGHSAARLIHVRVADSDDAAEVKRVRVALEKLGATDLRYERD
jgi:hypothetical protein